MAWVLLATTGALTLLVVVLGAVLLRLRSRLAAVESRVAASVESGAAQVAAVDAPPPETSSGAKAADYLITRIGEAEPDPNPVVRVDAAVFTDVLAKETLIHASSLAHGVRRALSPETRSRIRFHMRHEVKRARKQRRAEMRLAHREWAARQRVAAARGGAEDAAEPAA